MLQQTSVARVMPRYLAFIRAFPSFKRLSEASIQEVIKEWSGLGYNRRALALREGARQVTTNFHGRLPRTVDGLSNLPGVGHATASAVIVYAFNEPLVFIETNIRRVFIHFFFRNRQSVSDALIAPMVEKTLVKANPREWYYALMDYGSALRSAGENPNRRSSRYRVQPKFEGSMRQLRGRVLATIMKRSKVSVRDIEEDLGPDARIRTALSQLAREGFLQESKDCYSFK
jgi:A/G-specific adenine glycosylase